MPPVIRKMRHSDLAALVKLRHVTFFDDGKISREADRAGLAKLIDGDGFEAGFVAEIDGEPIGSCLFVREEIEPLHEVSPWLAGLVVAENHRGQGLGTTLIAAVERHAHAVGCREFYLYTDSAEALYIKLGWTVAERMDIDGEPLVLMKRKL